VQKILITGGVGYVGGRLAQYFLAQPNPPQLRLLTRRRPSQIPRWAEGLDLVYGEVRDQEALKKSVRGVDAVVHLVGANEIESSHDPEGAIAVTGTGTYRILTACKAAGVERFVYFSTFHVYGTGLQGIITEDILPRPVHPYAITHHLAEGFVTWHRDVFGIATLIFRLSNGYGCPADLGINRWTLVFNDLCLQAVQNRKLVLKTSGRQRRDFISLWNVARAVQHVLSLPTDRWGDGLYNLGSSCSLSILEVAGRIAQAYEKSRGKSVELRSV